MKGHRILLTAFGLAAITAAHANQSLDQKLFDAIRANDVAKVEKLLKAGANPNGIEANGWRPLMSAASQKIQISKLLIAKGADVNARQPDQGYTALIMAAQQAKGSALVQLLLDRGAKVSIPMTDGLTALHMAIRFKNPEAVSALLKAGADVNARTKQNPNLSNDAQSKASIAQSFEPGYTESGRTPVFELANAWDLKIAQLLKGAGAHFRSVDRSGWTLLHLAVKSGDISNVKPLLELGLDPNDASVGGFTPLHIAMRCGNRVPNVDITRLLLKYKANPSAKTRAGQTAADLLRSDFARMMQQSSLTSGAEKTNRQVKLMLDNDNKVLAAIDPKGAPIALAKAPEVNGWRTYPNLTQDILGSGIPIQVERKLRKIGKKTILSLTYIKGVPLEILAKNLALNGYEPLNKMPVKLIRGKAILLEFPVEAAQEGGNLTITYDFHSKYSTGSGSFGNFALQISPVFLQRETSAGREFSIAVYEATRPLEVQIDSVSRDGKAIHGWKPTLYTVTTGHPVKVPEMTVNRIGNHNPKVFVSYRYRLKPNTTWHHQQMALDNY
ncbi:hypothetical protein BH11ARM1_BH11ARM1_09890 [soil metagenome]